MGARAASAQTRSQVRSPQAPACPGQEPLPATGRTMRWPGEGWPWARPPHPVPATQEAGTQKTACPGVNPPPGAVTQGASFPEEAPPVESFQPENDEGPWDPASGVSWGDFRKSQPHVCASLAALPSGCAELLPTGRRAFMLAVSSPTGPFKAASPGLSRRGLPWATPLSLLSGCSRASSPSAATLPTQDQTRAGTCLSWSPLWDCVGPPRPPLQASPPCRRSSGRPPAPVHFL